MKALKYVVLALVLLLPNSAFAWHHTGGAIAAGVFGGFITGLFLDRVFAPPPAVYAYPPPVGYYPAPAYYDPPPPAYYAPPPPPPSSRDPYGDGYSDGYRQGYEQGRRERYREQYREGKKRGYEEGYQQEKSGEGSEGTSPSKEGASYRRSRGGYPYTSIGHFGP